ncbi:MAG: T9SS C-terminal target domain-containing protein [Flavobacteriia bacterium]|nr:T9SS C-terminal target domain-containing protein [Flavobacteriia bacterium]
MKRCIIALFILSSSFARAQTINCPNLPWGMTMEFDQINDTVPVSNSGPWDFSSLQTGVTYEMKVLPLDSSVHASNYPNATHVLQSANGEFFLSYDNTGLKSHGKVTSTTTSSYANALTLVPFPFNSTLIHVDSMASTLVWNTLTANVTEKVEVEGVANGNVTMPDGVTYQNAVVLSTIRTTVTGPSPFGTYLTVEEHSKVFWLPGQSFNANEKEVISVIVSPNPMSNLMSVNQPYENAYLYLFSVTGELILAQGLIKGDNQIDVSTLPVGLYTYRIIGENSRILIEDKVIKT